MAASRLSIGEQCIDRQARTELFRGRQIELVTGRVLLHAIDDHGQPLCGCDKGQLTPVSQSWDAGYLPHLPRCPSCTAQSCLLVQRPALTLTTFLHEQLHWLEGPGTVSASAEASERWPCPPPCMPEEVRTRRPPGCT